MAASMKKAIIKGRITKDVEIRRTQSGKAVCSFHIACDNGKDKNGQQYPADFIPCVAWGQKAEFIQKYFPKGAEILVEGELKTRTYDDERGSKHYIMEVNVSEICFCGSKSSSASNSTNSADVSFGGSAGYGSTDDIPF